MGMNGFVSVTSIKDSSSSNTMGCWGEHKQKTKANKYWSYVNNIVVHKLLKQVWYNKYKSIRLQEINLHA